MKMAESKELGTSALPNTGATASSSSSSMCDAVAAVAAAAAAAAATLPSTISEEEKEFAASSGRDYEAAKFKDCLTVLNRLANLRPNDNKVKQNKAVAEYVGGGLKFSETYLNTLNVISESIDEPEALEDLDHCVHYYNKALLHYHMCQYQTALSIGEKLVVHFVVPTEDQLARKFAFLMIELYLRTFQPEKALNLLHVAEKLILGNATTTSTTKNNNNNNNSGGGNNNGNNNNNAAAAAANSSSAADVKSASSPSSSSSSVDEEAWKTRLSLYKARGFMMLHSMKLCKRELKTLMASGVNSQAAIYLKAYFAYSARNPRKALKVINAALSASGVPSFSDAGGAKGGGAVSSPLPKAISCGESLASMYYNALGCIHNGLEKHALAALYFRKALDEDRKAVNEVRKNMAASAKGASPPTSFDGIPAYCIGLSRRPEILYNLGLQLLQSGKPIGAFDCLIEVVQVFHLNPRLWLRLAEACIMASRSSNEDSFEICERLRVVEGAVGSGIHRKVVFGRGLSPDYNQGSSSEFKTSAIPNATLEFASLCLRNALLLLPPDGGVKSSSGGGDAAAAAGSDVASGAAGPHSFTPLFDDAASSGAAAASSSAATARSTSASESSSNAAAAAAASESNSASAGNNNNAADAPPHPVEGPYFCSVAPSNPIRTQAEVSSLRCSILAASAYVALNLNESVVALRHAKALLAQPKLSGAHKFLGRLYLSEALLNLDNISEAVQHLNPDLVDDLTISPTEFAASNTSRSSNASSPACNSPGGGGAVVVVGGGGGGDAADDNNVGDPASSTTVRREGGSLGGGANRKWWPHDVTRAKGVAHLNLSVAHVIRGESDKARLNLDKAEEMFAGSGGGANNGGGGAPPSLPAHFLVARIYLDLLEGDRNRMQSLLKTHFGHVTGNAHAPDTQKQLHNVKWGC